MANSRIDKLCQEAILALQLGMPADNTYHPLYKAWQLWRGNPSELKQIEDKATFANGMMILLSYGTVHDIDTQQQIASVAYLFISMAIEETPNINLYKNRVILMISNEEAFRYTVSSVVNKGCGMFMMSLQPLLARDALFKMIYSDISTNPALCSVDLIAKRKKDLDVKIENGFFGKDEDSVTTTSEGKSNHSEVVEYLRKMVLEDEDVDF
ncbi:MAG: hypothetical protein K2O88_08405 [Paramuribaculum sp.]|nr:hypothetical protein [Paramuribaculum sp.]